jgi:hypothetical protein
MATVEVKAEELVVVDVEAVDVVVVAAVMVAEVEDTIMVENTAIMDMAMAVADMLATMTVLLPRTK